MFTSMKYHEFAMDEVVLMNFFSMDKKFMDEKLYFHGIKVHPKDCGC
jgi:hypothetical protein